MTPAEGLLLSPGDRLIFTAERGHLRRGLVVHPIPAGALTTVVCQARYPQTRTVHVVCPVCGSCGDTVVVNLSAVERYP